MASSLKRPTLALPQTRSVQVPYCSLVHLAGLCHPQGWWTGRPPQKDHHLPVNRSTEKTTHLAPVPTRLSAKSNASKDTMQQSHSITVAVSKYPQAPPMQTFPTGLWSVSSRLWPCHKKIPLLRPFHSALVSTPWQPGTQRRGRMHSTAAVAEFHVHPSVQLSPLSSCPVHSGHVVYLCRA